MDLTIAIAVAVVLLLSLSIDAQRVKMGRGAKLPGFLGRLSTGWGRWSANVSARAAKIVEQTTPDRSPDEVDDIRRRARAARIAREMLSDSGDGRAARARTKDPRGRQSRVRLSAPNRPRAKHGKRVCFTYVDEHGEVTDREVANWVRTRIHLEGFCTKRRALRTFRIDRIESWGDWQ